MSSSWWSSVSVVLLVACDGGASGGNHGDDIPGGAWTDVSSTPRPPARVSAQIAAFQDKAILYGGSISVSGGLSNLLSDTWSFDGTTWTELHPASVPPERFEFGMAALPDRIVVFGGAGSGTNDEQWEFTDTWTPVTIALPPKRQTHQMASLGNAVILFGGGLIGSAKLNDTWRYDGTTWTQLAPAHAPSGRDYFVMVSSNERILLYGGKVTPGNELWQFDGTDWTLLDSSGPTLLYPSGAALSDGIVVTGDNTSDPTATTWTWTPTGGWSATPSPPPTRWFSQMALLGDTVVAFGGSAGFSGPVLDDTWLYRP